MQILHHGKPSKDTSLHMTGWISKEEERRKCSRGDKWMGRSNRNGWSWAAKPVYIFGGISTNEELLILHSFGYLSYLKNIQTFFKTLSEHGGKKWNNAFAKRKKKK